MTAPVDEPGWDFDDIVDDSVLDFWLQMSERMFAHMYAHRTLDNMRRWTAGCELRRVHDIWGLRVEDACRTL